MAVFRSRPAPFQKGALSLSGFASYRSSYRADLQSDLTFLILPLRHRASIRWGRNLNKRVADGLSPLLFGSGPLLDSLVGRLHIFRLEALDMKLIRISLFFAAGVYFGLNFDKYGNVESIASALQSVAQKLQELQR